MVGFTGINFLHHSVLTRDRPNPCLSLINRRKP